MKSFELYWFIIICYIQFIKVGNAKMELNVLVPSFNGYEEVYKNMFLEFNQYSISNNLDIEIIPNVVQYENAIDSHEKFNSIVEDILKKNKYDFYLYDSFYRKYYSPYLLDLKKYLPHSHIDMYIPRVIEESCMFKDKLIGLPFTVFYIVLYSNKELLKKYNQKPPKTWDQLIEISKYIIEEEKKLNNTDLIGYNGLFDDSEQGYYSLYEFLYSFRDSFNSSIPEPHDPLFTEALKMINKIKEEVSSDIVFRSNEFFSSNLLNNKKAIFLKYFIVSEICMKICNMLCLLCQDQKKVFHLQ